MRRICFTYHMTNEQETAETCVSLLMVDEVADDILTHGDDSPLMAPGTGDVFNILERLSNLQGYEFIGVVHAKEVSVNPQPCGAGSAEEPSPKCPSKDNGED